MSPSPLNLRDIKRKLLAAGFEEVSQKGSHVKFGKQTETGYRTVIVPAHRAVAFGTLRSVLRQAGITQDQFDAL